MMRIKGEWEEMERSVRLERSCAEDEEVYRRKVKEPGGMERVPDCSSGVRETRRHSDGHDCSMCRLAKHT